MRRSAWKLVVLALGLVALLPARPVFAEVYEVPILVDTEDDLRDLLENGDISEEEYDRLVQLLGRPLDLNRSRRDAFFDLPGVTYSMIEKIVTYREAQVFRDASDLERAGIPLDVIRQVRPFVKVSKKLQRPPIVEGEGQLRLLEEFEDGRTPALYVRLRSTFVDFVQVGFAGVMQDRPGTFGYHHEPGLTWLSADESAPRFQAAKYYAMIDRPAWGVIVGTYQAGFGERLVFDETTRINPDGFYPDDLLSEYEESASFGVRERLFGVAASMKGIPVGEDAGVINGTLFLSWFPYDVSQDDVDSRLRPQDDSSVYAGDTDPNPLYCESGVDPVACATLGTGRFSSSRIRGAFTETIVGANLAYLPSARWEVGLTGYWARVDWDWQEPNDLYFTESARYPDRDSYGAFGVSLKGHYAFFSLFSEYAYAFGGGSAVILRTAFGWDKVDLEISGRYYAAGFDNPHARGSATADEYQGQRDRDEGGGRLRLSARPLDWLNGRVDLDVWYRPSLDYASLKMTTRFDFDITDWMTFSIGLDYTDKDISAGGRDEEYEDDVSESGGEKLRDVGAGARLAIWEQLRFDITPRVRLLLFNKSTLWDAEVTLAATAYQEPIRRRLNSFYDESFAHDYYVYLLCTARVIDTLVLSARIKYLDEQMDFAFRGESFLEGWVQVRWQIIPELAIQTRYRVRGYLDERDSVRADWGPDTNPEHLLKVGLVTRF